MSTTIDIRTGANRTNQPVIGWKNIALNRSVSATSAALGFPAIAARTYASYEGWKPIGSFGTFTMTVNSTIDYIGLFFQGSGTVQLSYVTGGTTIVLGSFPASGAVFALINAASVTSVIITVSGFSGYLANVMLGRYTEIQRRIYVGHRPISYARNVDRVQGLSESGQFLGHIVRRKTKATRVDISNLTPDYYQNVLDEFVEASTSQPHYWSYRREIPQGGADALTWGSLAMVWGGTFPSAVNAILEDGGVAWIDPEIANGSGLDTSPAITLQPVVSATDQAAWAQVQGNPDVDNSLSNGMMSAGWDIVAL